MSIPLIIQGTTVNIPSSSDDPNWAPGIIAFCQAVTTALSSVVGTYDVSPQVLNIDSSNPGSGTATGLSFSTSNVRAADIYYSVYRATNSTSAYETGVLQIVYNVNNSSSQKWEISREYTGSGASITFTISDAGQVSYTTTSISGSSHTGVISYFARSLTNS